MGAAVGIGVGVGGVVGVFTAPAPLHAAASKRASNVSPPKTREFMETRRRIADVNRSEPHGAGAPVSRARYGRIACAPPPAALPRIGYPMPMTTIVPDTERERRYLRWYDLSLLRHEAVRRGVDPAEIEATSSLAAEAWDAYVETISDLNGPRRE